MTNLFNDEQKQDVEDEVNSKLDNIEKNLQKKVKIAVIGKVSTGKSSLINALFNVKKGEATKAHVGAVSGVTTKIKEIQWSKNVTIIDSPGLGDVVKENSQETQTA